MNKRSDEIGYVTWQDAMRTWWEVCNHYGINIELRSVLVARKGDGFTMAQVFHVTKLVGQAKPARLFSRPLEYPGRQYRTYPAALVYHLSGICVELEARGYTGGEASTAE